MMNMASAQPNMNHTLALRPTKLDFSSSSFVVIFLSLLARRVAVKCGRRAGSKPGFGFVGVDRVLVAPHVV